MDRFCKAVAGVSRLLDRTAGLCLAGVMVMVVVNVVSRRVFGNPFLGVYEYVCFLTAVVIAFSLAYCAVKEGHITVDFLVNRLPRRVRVFLEPAVNLLMFLFLSLATWRLVKYAGNIQATGQVSQTTEIPFYIFVYLVAAGFFMLGLTALVNTIKSLQSVME